MEPSKITLNRGFVAGISIALAILAILTVGVFEVIGIIVVVTALVSGSIVGLMVYFWGISTDKKKKHEVSIDK